MRSLACLFMPPDFAANASSEQGVSNRGVVASPDRLLRCGHNEDDPAKTFGPQLASHAQEVGGATKA